jgi:hypothetical protein
MSIKLVPGSAFPSTKVSLVGGGETDLAAAGKYKLVVVFRGAFCPFCIGINLSISLTCCHGCVM